MFAIPPCTTTNLGRILGETIKAVITQDAITTVVISAATNEIANTREAPAIISAVTAEKSRILGETNSDGNAENKKTLIITDNHVAETARNEVATTKAKTLEDDQGACRSSMKKAK